MGYGVSYTPIYIPDGTAPSPTTNLLYANAGHLYWNGVQIDAGGSGTPGNPTASVGLAAVNGSASTYMRSDAAPALDQSISPTWSGNHTFSNALTLSDVSAPSPTTNKLYSVSGALYWNGTALGSGGGIPWFRTLSVPTDSGFSWVNQDSATSTQNTGSVSLVKKTHSGDSVAMRIKTLPAGDYDISFGFVPLRYAANSGISLILRDSVSGKFITADLFASTATAIPSIRIVEWNSPTSASTALTTTAPGMNPNGPCFFRVASVSGTRTWYISIDGQTWHTILSHANTTWVTPDTAGYGVSLNDTGASAEVQAIAFHWSGL